MFDFEKLQVYDKAKLLNTFVLSEIEKTTLHRAVENQLVRAALSIMLNIAEGSGRNTKPDKRRFYVFTRGSTLECAAIFDYLVNSKKISRNVYNEMRLRLEEISKMLFVMMRNLGTSKNSIYNKS